MKIRLLNYSLQVIHSGSAVYGYFWINTNCQNLAKFMTALSVCIALLAAVVIAGLTVMNGAAKDEALQKIKEGSDGLLFRAAHHLSSLAVIASFAWFGHFAWAFSAVFEWALICFLRSIQNEMVKEMEKGTK